MRMADPALWSFRLERDRAPCEQSSHHVQFHAIKGFSQRTKTAKQRNRDMWGQDKFHIDSNIAYKVGQGKC